MTQESTYIFRMLVGFILNPNSTFIVYTTSSTAGVGSSLPWYVSPYPTFYGGTDTPDWPLCRPVLQKRSESSMA